ncbi:MAG: class I SAM-dependent methyltransferase [Pseudomonadota bacterium]
MTIDRYRAGSQPVGTEPQIAAHYESGELWGRLLAALAEDNVDSEALTLEALSPYDHFHGRGLEATEQMATRMTLDANGCLLDVGSGLGGPARFFANHLGCRVTGVDLTPEFCAVAVALNERLGLSDRIDIHCASALEMPVSDDTFDGAYSMNVSMNIEDKGRLYREIHRVLRPGARLWLSEIAKGPNDGLTYPTPWASAEAFSFLSSLEDTVSELKANGFDVVRTADTLVESADFAKRSRSASERGDKPLHRAVSLVHGALGMVAAKNSAAGMRAGQIIPVEIECVAN